MVWDYKVVMINTFFLSLPHIPAYIDPGTGSIMIQLIIGVAATGVFVGKLFWGKVKAVVGGWYSKVKRNRGPG